MHRLSSCVLRAATRRQGVVAALAPLSSTLSVLTAPAPAKTVAHTAVQHPLRVAQLHVSVALRADDVTVAVPVMGDSIVQG